MEPLAIAGLGAFAGVTIFLGFPFARMRSNTAFAKGLVNAVALGILLFLFFDVMQQAWADPVSGVQAAFLAAYHGHESLVYPTALFALLAVGFALGLVGIVAFEQRFLRSERAATPTGAVAPASLALMIAIGIGLHNFGEGLAIGAEAASGALAFAVVLAIGFALHNMTEGFGIAAPLAGERPSWAFLGLAGLIGGGPTFLGTLVGMYFPSPALGIFFLSVAGGAIVYVVKELFHQTRRFVGARAIFAMAAVTLGFLLGLTTDLLVTLGGV